jgi:hypothetical protein
MRLIASRLFVLLVAGSLFQSGKICEEAIAKPGPQDTSVCQLVDNWKHYNRQKVRVHGTYVVGREQAWIEDPSCEGEEYLTAVSFASGSQANTKRLDQILKKDRRARVVFEGIFYGPEPFDSIDPRLPTPLRDALKKSHKMYGHMNSFDSMIEVTKVVKASEVEAGNH